MPVVGASGAVSGLMAVAARLIAGQGRLGPILSSPVLSMAGAVVVLNLLVALFGGAVVPGAGGAAIAWEAHLAGFAAGLILARPFAWLARA
jgi:membrane associated rhomboid family serine protease